MRDETKAETPNTNVPASSLRERVLEGGTALGARIGPLASHMWAMKGRVLIGAVIIGVGGYFAAGAMLGTSVVVDTAVRGDFIQTVVASGHVEAPNRVDVGTQITGVVAQIPVGEGQIVKTGDTLIILDDREARASMVQAEGVVAQAEARMRQLNELTLPSAEQNLRQAQATLLNTQKTYDRVVKLAHDGYSTKVALDDATKNLDIAKTQVRNAEFQVATSRPGGSDFVMAETQLKQARASLVTAQSRLSYTIVKAPRDGILIARDVEIGNVVQPGKVLMKLSPAGETQVVVQIDEKNLGLIAVGQKALVSADAYAKSSFPAEVIYINPSIDLARASVEVKLRAPNPPDYLRQDMTVSVDVAVADRKDAIILPAGSLRGRNGPKPWVMKVEARHAVRQPVTVGLVSGGKAEILSGLAAGDVTIPSTNKLIKAGQRVRASAPASPTQ